MLRSKARKAQSELEEAAGPQAWLHVEQKLHRERKIAYKAAQNRTRQSLQTLVQAAGRDIPAWLQSSGRSFLETSEIEKQEVQQARTLRLQVSSTPVRPRAGTLPPLLPPGVCGNIEACRESPVHYSA